MLAPFGPSAPDMLRDDDDDDDAEDDDDAAPAALSAAAAQSGLRSSEGIASKADPLNTRHVPTVRSGRVMGSGAGPQSTIALALLLFLLASDLNCHCRAEAQYARHTPAALPLFTSRGIPSTKSSDVEDDDEDDDDTS